MYQEVWVCGIGVNTRKFPPHQSMSKTSVSDRDARLGLMLTTTQRALRSTLGRFVAQARWPSLVELDWTAVGGLVWHRLGLLNERLQSVGPLRRPDNCLGIQLGMQRVGGCVKHPED